MRSLIRTNVILGLILLALGIASYVFVERQFLAESPPALSQKVSEIQDIEHLRKLTLLLLRSNDEIVRNTNQVFVMGIQAFAALCFLCAVLFIANSLAMLKHIRAAEGQASKWLRWL